MMGRPPWPPNSRGDEIRRIQALVSAADRHREPDVRRALSDAMALICDLIEERGRWCHGDDGRDGYDAPHPDD